MKSMQNKWRLMGYDTFESEEYSLDGAYDDEEAARKAASARLQELERTQPAAYSGGQGFGGIQDRVYIVRPNGSRYRFIR